jgi:plasmid stability protein
MSAVTIDGLEDWVLASYRARAEATGRTVEEEVRRVLTREVRAEAIANGAPRELTEAERAVRREAIAKVDAAREHIAAKYGVLDDSTPGIRAERDARD